MNLDSLVSKVGYQLTAVVRKQVTDHLTLVTGVEKEIQNISTNLRKIQQVVHDAETRQTKDSNIKEWLEKLEDFSYEIEDVVDEWNTEIRRYQVEADEFVEKVWCCFLSYVLCFNIVKTRHDIGVKIKKLNEKLELIVKEKDKYNFLPSVKVNSKEWKRMESTSFSDNISTSAQEEAKKKLIHKLCTITKNPIQIIKIAGVGGIGKTTLSQLAFNDKKVEVQFDKKIWICVGESFDGLKIANGILKSLNKDSKNESKDEFKDESHVEIALKKIHKTILKKKVLLVLDDVWMVNEVDWEKLKRCTSDVASGSKIVVTTRSGDVAKTLGATDEVSVKLLTNDDCWRVIKNIALWGTSEDICKKFEPVGKKIAEKCKGLPLAAKALGSLLRFRGTKKEWEEVQKSKLWQLAGVVDDVFPLLQLSYTDLPSAMKRCFVFCAILPKDDEIDVDDLIRMWIAQGYIITENRGDKMEQIGIRYFRGLVSRGFFQEVSKESNGILTCKMHDIVHDFAQYLAKEECVTLGEAKEADSCKDVRHLAITCKDIDVGALISFLLSVYQTGKTRSIFIRTMGISERMLRLLCHLKHLRILRIHDKGLKKLPKEVGNLSHLRLLDVKRTELEELPDKICDLHNLQALYCCVYIRKLPLNIWRLMNLRTLHVGSSIMEIPQSIERLTNLQHLPVYGVGKNSNKLSYLRNLNQLRGHMLIRFRQEMSRQTDVEEAKMAEFEKKKIDSLVLSLFGSNASKEVIEALKPHPNLSELVLSGYLAHQLPDWITELNCLRHLNLPFSIHLKSFQPLWKLPFLETLQITQARLTRLSISDFFGLDETADKNCTCYPNLKTLEFSCWGDLVKWDDIDMLKEIHVSAIIMPCLEKLQVNYADRLEVLPYNLLSKATKLHSIEFNEIKYGPITSLSSNKPPFVRLPNRQRTTSASPFTNNCGDELFFRMLHIPRSVSIKGQQYSIPQTLLTRQENGRLPDLYSILLPREMVRQTIFHPGHVHNLKSHQFELAIHKLNNQINNELNIHRTINRSPQIIEFDESDVDDNEDEVVVEPSALVAPKVGVCAEEREEMTVHENVEREEMTVHENVPFVSKRPIIVERPSNVVFMANGHGHSLGAEQSTLTMVPKVSGTEIYPPGNVPKNKQISAVPKPPFHPSTDFYYDHSKYSLLSSWIDKNSHRSDEIGLVPIIQQYDSISAKKLHQICSNDWLSNEDTDAILQLFNLQAKRYPGMYKSIKWTCLGSLYNVAVQSEYKIFIENRQKEEGGIGKKIDVDLYNFVMGKNKSWESKAWCECDYVFGVENIDNGHWVAYAYDFKNKTVNIYDSLLNGFKDNHMEVFKKHTIIAPSLYNLNSDNSDGTLNPVTPFTITVESVPQQHNTHDCGVYACKFVQCLAMQDDFSKLAAARFPDYRKKLAIDLIKWTRTSNDMFAFHELQIKT